jgi:hypothetical protein
MHMIATTQLVIENLVAKVRELARKRPNNIYQPVQTEPKGYIPSFRCTYLGGTCTDGTVGCLVGQALAAIGFTISRLESVDKLPIEEALEKLIARDRELTSKEYDQINWLNAVQTAQDTGKPWCNAVAIADQEEPL